MSEVTFAKTLLSSLDKKPIKLAADHVSDPRKYPGQSPYILPRQTHPFPRKTVPQQQQQSKPSSVTATLKPMRAGAGETVTISKDLTLDSTIYDVKVLYAQQSGQAQEKVKLLLNKKPAADLKTLKDLGVQGENVEFSVMLMGGASAGGSASASQVSSPVVEKSEAAAVAAAGGATATAAAMGEVNKKVDDGNAQKGGDDSKMDVDEPSAPGSENAQVEADKASQPTGAEGILKTEEFWADLKGFLVQRLNDEKEGEKLARLFREASDKKV